MPSVMTKFIAQKMRAPKRQRRPGSTVTLPTPQNKPVHLLNEIMLDVALFLNRVDLDAVQISCQRQRTFVRDNARLIPLRKLARISFEHNPPEGRVKVWIQPSEQRNRSTRGSVQSVEFLGTWAKILEEKDQFQNVVRYSTPRRLKLTTPMMNWDFVRALFGDTPSTIRVSSEVLIGDQVEPNIIGIQEFLRPFALIKCLNISEVRDPRYYASSVRKRVAEQCNDRFLRGCIENSITRLELGEHGAVLSDAAVLDFCFGPHGSDSEPRHLKARFQCSDDFMTRLLEANRKCGRKGRITMNVMAKVADAPNVAELAPYRVEGTRGAGDFDVTTFLLPDEFDSMIVCSYRVRGRYWDPWNCRITVSRPAHPNQ